MTMPTTIPGDAWGGAFLAPFVPLLVRYRNLGGPLRWMHPAAMLRPGAQKLHGDGRDWYEVAFRDGGALGEDDFLSEDIALDPTDPIVAHRVVDVARAGERCVACLGTGRCPCGKCTVACEQCAGAGYLRPPHDLSALLPPALGGKAPAALEHAPCPCGGDGVPVGPGARGCSECGLSGVVRRFVPASEVSALYLARSVERIAAGLGPVRGVLGEWAVESDGRPRRRPVGSPCGIGLVVVDAPNPGSDDSEPRWVLWDSDQRDKWGSPVHLARGPETGPAGRAAADAAALDLGYALLDPAAPHGLALPPVTR